MSTILSSRKERAARARPVILLSSLNETVCGHDSDVCCRAGLFFYHYVRAADGRTSRTGTRTKGCERRGGELSFQLNSIRRDTTVRLVCFTIVGVNVILYNGICVVSAKGVATHVGPCATASQRQSASRRAWRCTNIHLQVIGDIGTLINLKCPKCVVKTLQESLMCKF